MKGEFVHLHVHSHYSLLDGAATIDNLIAAAQRQKMHALALTDHGNLFGAVEFYRKAIAKGIKPIVGCEVYVAPGDRREKGGGPKDASYHLTLLVRNQTGYRNLVKMVTDAYLQGFYYKPRIDKDLLAEHADGLVALTGCLKSEVNQALTGGDRDRALGAIDDLRQIVGKDHVFLEVMHHGIPQQDANAAELVRIGKERGIPIVGTNDVHYVRKEDARAHDAFLCIGMGRLVHDTDRMRYATQEFFLKSPAEMKEVFREIPEAVTNTLAVAEQCHLEMDFDTHHLPRFEPPDGSAPDACLRRLCEEGLVTRYGAGAGEEPRKRLAHELGIIEQMGFASYFLIVWDFVRFAKQSGIPVGPGRGSAAGSIVSYCLGITDIDPLAYDLIFERFLMPGRISLPDIDIDLCKSGRDRVIEYVREKYGRENVAQIITFGTLAARAAIRDVGRVLDVPLGEVDAIAKRIPPVIGISLADALRDEPELKQLHDRDPRVRELFEIARGVEGLCRHASTHAAGVVIADRPLTEYLPLYRSGEDIMTQFAMKDVEAIGLLKMDFLGLKTLSILDTAEKGIRARHDSGFDLRTIPLDDPETFGMLARGESTGVFQLESGGMRDLLQRLKPDTFGDVIAVVALFRPGPLGSGMVDDFVKRKHGKIKVTYDHPVLEPILKDTYGVIVYQEQVMRIANRMAGFSMSDTDTLRKAMGKKEPQIMTQFRQQFLDGAKGNGIDPRIAERIWEQMAYFGGYGFNKAHATAYGLVAYRTAYLKAHYPTEFMAAMMTWEKGNTDKIVELMDACRRMGIEILPPAVDESQAAFTVVGENRVRFGLGAVKGVGDKAIESIVAAREAGGPFEDLFDFCERVDLRLVNKSVIENLIRCGAFDGLGARRAQLAAVLPRAMEMGSRTQTDRRRGQATLFEAFAEATPVPEALPDVEEWPESERLAYEKKALGFYVSGHPLARHERLLRQFASTTVRDLGEGQERSEIVLGGVVTKVRKTVTKRGKMEGERMAQFVIEDLTGSVNAVIFPRDFEKYGRWLVPEQAVFVQGKLDLRREEPSVQAGAVIPIERAYEEFAGKATIRVTGPGVDDDTLYRVREVLRTHPGRCPVYLEVGSALGDGRTVRVGNDFFVTPSDRFTGEIESLLGPGHLRFAPLPSIRPKGRSAFRG